MSDSSPVIAADGRPLKASLNRALRRQKIRALLLIAPLLVFVLVTFIAPIADMLFRSVENDIVSNTLPRTVIALEDWDAASGAAPDEAVFAALAADLAEAVKAKRHTQLGTRLNYELSGMSSLFRKTGRKVKRMDMDGPFKPQFLEIEEDWDDPTIWATIKANSSRYTAGYFLNAVDLQNGPDGIEKRPENQRIYMKLFGRTIFLSVSITLSCFLLGYPIAFLLANLKARTSNILMILVLLPFWTSLLVRTSAWKGLLQQQEEITDTLV